MAEADGTGAFARGVERPAVQQARSFGCHQKHDESDGTAEIIMTGRRETKIQDTRERQVSG